jgi:nitroreductase
MMEMRDLVWRCRSYRRFDGSFRVEEATLRELAAVARGVASAANRQPLKHVLSCAADWNLRIFETLGWAAYLENWAGPEPEERPTAYVVILLVVLEDLPLDGSIKYYRDSQGTHHVPKRRDEELIQAVYS